MQRERTSSVNNSPCGSDRSVRRTATRSASATFHLRQPLLEGVDHRSSFLARQVGFELVGITLGADPGDGFGCGKPREVFLLNTGRGAFILFPVIVLAV